MGAMPCTINALYWDDLSNEPLFSPVIRGLDYLLEDFHCVAFANQKRRIVETKMLNIAEFLLAILRRSFVGSGFPLTNRHTQ